MAHVTRVRVYHEKLGGHRHADFFVGNGKAGTLVFQDDELRDEWSPFEKALRRGVDETGAGEIELFIEERVISPAVEDRT